MLSLTLIQEIENVEDNKIIDFVRENYTFEDLLNRCREAIISEFRRDYENYKTEREIILEW